jgi:serine/threonine protein kinase
MKSRQRNEVSNTASKRQRNNLDSKLPLFSRKNKVNEFDELFRNSGSILGKGSFGETRMVQHEGMEFVLKRFFGGHEGDNAECNKDNEEWKHMQVWKRLSRGSCRDYICQPIKTAHPYISAQLSARQSGNRLNTSLQVSTLEAFVKLVHNSRNDIDTDISQQIGKALFCIHSNGVLHKDVKSDNIIVVHKLDDQGKIDRNGLKVKLIDFGKAKVVPLENPLVTKKNNREWNLHQVINNVNGIHSWLNLPNNKMKTAYSKAWNNKAVLMNNTAVKNRTAAKNNTG